MPSRGVTGIVPTRLLKLFAWQQVEILVSGNPIIDIELWKRKSDTSSINSKTANLSGRSWRASQMPSKALLSASRGKAVCPRKGIYCNHEIDTSYGQLPSVCTPCFPVLRCLNTKPSRNAEGLTHLLSLRGWRCSRLVNIWRMLVPKGKGKKQKQKKNRATHCI